MLRYLIISTYPEHGSMNVGDKLITEATKRAIRYLNGDAKFDVVWRAEAWENVKDKVYSADVVVFACLAIRPQMHAIEYPYLHQVLESGKPYAALASGTDLPMLGRAVLETSAFSKKTMGLLQIMNEQALAASARGVLTKLFLDKHNCSNFTLDGDIAFFDPRFDGLRFQSRSEIQRIAITDPHHFGIYLPLLEKLIDGLREIFPEAILSLFQHGKCPPSLQNLLELKRLDVNKIFLMEQGLDAYADIDMHVGFRVHGHVSALSRRKYSYLLEQDGRGCDYGLTIQRNISQPCFIQERDAPGIKNVLRPFFNRRKVREHAITHISKGPEPPGGWTHNPTSAEIAPHHT